MDPNTIFPEKVILNLNNEIIPLENVPEINSSISIVFFENATISCESMAVSFSKSQKKFTPLTIGISDNSENQKIASTHPFFQEKTNSYTDLDYIIYSLLPLQDLLKLHSSCLYFKTSIDVYGMLSAVRIVLLKQLGNTITFKNEQKIPLTIWDNEQKIPLTNQAFFVKINSFLTDSNVKDLDKENMIDYLLSKCQTLREKDNQKKILTLLFKHATLNQLTEFIKNRVSLVPAWEWSPITWGNFSKIFFSELTKERHEKIRCLLEYTERVDGSLIDCVSFMNYTINVHPHSKELLTKYHEIITLIKSIRPNSNLWNNYKHLDI